MPPSEILPREPGVCSPVGHVYLIRNLHTGRVYVGMSRTGEKRLQEHQSDLRLGQHPKAELQADWLALGPAAFTFEVVETCTSITDGLRREHELTEEFAATEAGVYNQLPRVWRTEKFLNGQTDLITTSLKEIRESKRMTIAALARSAGVSRQTIYTIEAGRRGNASLRVLAQLAAALNVPLADLVAVPA